ncbi:MAG: hypothetical protein KGS72_15185 [Cyanobacteria bacterium REEB67]|nr:hypothetical protein [Cyanobacteria bacterium REEB67]
MSKQIVPPDPYGTDAPTVGTSSSVDADSVSAPVSSPPSPVTSTSPLSSALGAALSGSPMSSNGSATASYNQAPAPVLPIETVAKEVRSAKGKNGGDAAAESLPFGNNPIAGYNGGHAAPLASGAASGSPLDNFSDAVSKSGNGSAAATKKESTAEVAVPFAADAGDSTDKFSPEPVSGSLGAVASEPSSPAIESHGVKPGRNAGNTAQEAKGQQSQNAQSGESVATMGVTSGIGATADAASVGLAVGASSNTDQILELLNNLDTQVGICSVNVAQLAKSAAEQLEVVRNLAEVVQNQAFGEIGLSLSSLSESMSAALEPMKAVGELVPAIDGLVTTLQEGNSTKSDSAKLTPDELVMSLANQLSNQQIDPWTFKCAYMAVFPSEHPADLLRKLVDLLGTQTLSGDLFRAAYDAVQAPDPPRPVYNHPVSYGGEDGVREVVKVVQDEAVLAQIEELRKFNEDLRLRMDQREGEYAEMLAAKDSEVQQTQLTLNARFEEFNNRYEEVSDLVRQRNDLIEQKDTELQQKDSELQILRSQLDEMRDQTHNMVADLQRQLTTTQQAVEEAAKVKPALTKAQTNFFEANSTPAPQAPQQQQQSLFNEQAAQPNFNQTGAQQLGSGGVAPGISINAAPPLPLPAPPQPQPEPQPQVQMAQPMASPQGSITQAELQPVGEPVGLASNLASSAISNQAIPRPQVSAPTTPMMQSGSYGSGVRAQVFEVIVRQALAGAPWREICAGPMQVNNISPDEVEGEVKRRQALLKK